MERKIEKLIVILDVLTIILLLFSMVSDAPNVDKEVVNKNVTLVVEDDTSQGFKGENCIDRSEISSDQTIKGAEEIFCN